MIFRRKPPDPAPAAAKDRASQHLVEVQRRWPEVRAVADSLRESIQENHWAERIEVLIRGGQ